MKETEGYLNVWVDGSFSNGAGIGVVIDDGKKKRVYKKSVQAKTNNQAEYLSAIFALKKIKQIFGKNVKNFTVKVHSDSQLLVSQMLGKWKIKDDDIKDLFIELHNLTLDFKKVDFIHVPRKENKLADKLSKAR